MQELGCDLIKPVVTGLEMKGQLIWGQMGPTVPEPYLTDVKLTLHMLTCIEVNF